jgi:primary-amine oxidase
MSIRNSALRPQCELWRLRWLQRALAALLIAAPAAARANPPHPLDPLQPEEIRAAVELLQRDPRFPAGALLPLLARAEPSKQGVSEFRPGQPFEREVAVVVYDRPANLTYEARVDLRAGAVRSWRPRPGVQPGLMGSDHAGGAALLKADPRWQAAMRRRGIEDFSRVKVDSWAAGGFAPPQHAASRLLRGISYLRDGAIFYHGRPIEGVTALIDMTQQRVVQVLDTGPLPIAAAPGELGAPSQGGRPDLRPLRVEQPEGASFRVEGWQVSWQKWRLRLALHPRDGLVLYAVSYDEASGAPRSILYRAALAEMLVPYFDGDAHWLWRNAFDEGEYGLGRLTGSLDPGRDVPAHAVFFPAHFSDEFGKPYTVERAAALYERELDLLWKHYDNQRDHNEARLARELVLHSVATIGNYDYGISWIFGQDGALRFELALTGIMLAKGVAAPTPGEPDHGGGHRVAPQIAAPHHQHFFSVRLDLDVDGTANTALESNVRLLPPSGADPVNRIAMEETPLASERTAQRQLDLAASRRWSVVHASRRNSLGTPTGFALLPETNSVPYLHPNSSVRRRAGFVDHHLWVTRYKPDELYAAGDFPNQSTGPAGLPVYASDDEALVGEDVVLWYTLGTTHLPRPEEWPVMPVHRIGFRLVPSGFFERNPALDVPVPPVFTPPPTPRR